MNPAELTYEQAVERLEAIVGQIESGEVGLEASIALYEEGVTLGKHCREILTKAQQRIEELSRAQPREEAGGSRDEDA